MSISDNINSVDPTEPHLPPDPRRRRRRAGAFGLAALGLVVGLAGGAGAMKLARPSVEVAPMTPVAISAMADDSLVTIKGKVAEIFGNKFIVQDDSGRALVETGPQGEGGKLVASSELVTIQGRFDDGFLHGSYIVHEDGRTEALGPAGKPPHKRPLEMLKHLKP
ncbi:hypothetical protein HGO37_18600 [Rhizobium sp. CG4]|jgi:uncharacterized protein YdeI (BOF family)|uniref:hypothetical protein n=1 Tax=unclassified Rhizobium TaxID=2613769 RepID=UPI0020336685|nr:MULTISPECIES: hypothetical protein [unclassified Rhizobium]MCM2457412.1 hypothetical protein [Rhizobium sp. CG4]MCS4244997.1 uncharacterized protein YdeI (BOF family) [Rhizobium sp. BIGb0125]